ncbi:MAG: ATP-binding cassette domain-containing protein [bacterium]
MSRKRKLRKKKPSPLKRKRKNPNIILHIEELGLDFEEKGATRTILDHLNLLQKKGEWLALIGPNGAGKTSLGLIIKGLLNPTRGHLRMFSHAPDEDLRLRKSRTGFLFSNPRDQICALTVQDDIAFGLLHHGLSKKEIRNRVNEVMDLLGINHLAHQLTHKISGGEQQKVALAGLIALNPDYMILDEPANFLSPKEREGLLHILKNLHHNGTSILFISSGWEEIFMADRVAVLHNGLISWSGPPDSLLQEEKITEMIGYCLPDIYQLAMRLRQHGIRLPEHIHDVNEMVLALTDRFKGKGN